MALYLRLLALLLILLLHLAVDYLQTPSQPPPSPTYYKPGDGRQAWLAARGPHSPLTIGGTSLWCPIPGVLADWWLLPHLLTAAFNVPAVLPHNASSPHPPDLFLIGNYADSWGAASEGLEMRNSSLRLFIASEAYEHYLDGLVDFVDASFSPRRDLEHLPQYTSFPLLFFTLVDRAAAESASSPLLCPIHASLFSPALLDATAWRARTNYSLLLTTHMPHPRWLLYYQMSAHGLVEHPGPLQQLRNFYWPTSLPNNRAGKIALLRRFRYSLCPENSHSPGYVTEKLVEAHLSGAVPVYWGDVQAFPELFNPRRVLFYDEVNDVNGTALGSAIFQLENNASARALFFAQPVLAEGAQAWVEGQCRRAAGSLDAAMARLLARQLAVKKQAGMAEGWSLAGRRRRPLPALPADELNCTLDGCSQPRLSECRHQWVLWQPAQYCTVARDY